MTSKRKEGDDDIDSLKHLRISTITEKEAEHVLKRDKCEVGSTIVCDKLKPNERYRKTTYQLNTNVYELAPNNPNTQVYSYRVNVVAVTKSDRRLPLSGPSASDYQKFKRREICRSACSRMITIYDAIFGRKCMYYDLASLLFCTENLNLPTNPNFSVDISAEEKEEFLKPFKEIDIAIQPTGKVPIWGLHNVTKNVGEMNNGWLQFLNIVTSQDVFDRPNEFVTFSTSLGYVYNAAAHGLSTKDVRFESNSSLLGFGFRKSAHVIEDGTNPYLTGEVEHSGSVGLVIECKKTPLHNCSESVYQKSCKILGIKELKNVDASGVEKLRRMLKGLSIELIRKDKPSKTTTIDGISPNNATNEFIDLSSGLISVQNYFMDKYNYQLRYPLAPLVLTIERFRGTPQKNAYPMEICYILDNQRVKTNQQDPRQVQEMIKECAVNPFILYNQINAAKNSLRLSDNNSYLNEIGLTFSDQPVTVRSVHLNPPQLNFGVNPDINVQVTPEKWDWKFSKYFAPSHQDKWAAFAFLSDTSFVHQHTFERFLDRFCSVMKSSGMNYSLPHGRRVFLPKESGLEAMKETIEDLCKNGYQYVLVAHPDHDDSYHHALKYLERRLGIITQGVKITTVNKVAGDSHMMTLKNIVNKTNVKNGGLNYTLAELDHESSIILNGTLVIGIGINHPAGGFGFGEQDNGTGIGLFGPNGNGGGNGARSGGGRIASEPGHSAHRADVGTLPSTSAASAFTFTNGNNGDKRSSGGSSTKSSTLPPSVVGYSANDGNKPFAFSGSFYFQEARRDTKIEIVENIVSGCVRRYASSHGDNFPNYIIIYRNGCSNGQFKNVLKYEFAYLEHRLRADGCTSSIIYIIPNKLQPIRFFQPNIDIRMSPPNQNIRPGTVIDTGVVHPCFTQYFLCSHRTLQGTAKVPCYTVLRNQQNFTIEQLEKITNYLCYGHQVVYSPTSLPTPVYVAEEYAKRGRNMYNSWAQQSTPSVDLTYEDLNSILGHEYSELLFGKRVNA